MNHSRLPRITDVTKSLEQADLLNRLLRIALQDQPLNRVMEQALDELLTLSWLKDQPKAGVFLSDGSGCALPLTAARNLGPDQSALCARQQFGHCRCGSGADQSERLCQDARHNGASTADPTQGAYTVPIVADQKMLGLLVVHLPPEHERDETETAFLESYADLLALLIHAKRRDLSTDNAQGQLRDALAETSGLMGTIKSHTIFSQTSVDGTITDVNDAHCRITGYSREELIGSPHRLINSGHHSPAFWAHFWKTISSGQAWRGEICNKGKDGQLYWVDSIIMPFLNGDGKIERYVSIRFDITERKQAEEALARMGRILDDSSNEIYVFNAHTLRFTLVNRGARTNLGYSADEVADLTPFDIKPDHTAESFASMIAPLLRQETDRLSFETCHERKDGSRYPVAIDLQYATEEHPPVFVAIVQDITERKVNDARIERLAFYDPLTDLANRALMADRLKQAVARAARGQHKVRLLYMDLNRFKEINDTRGHAVGDRVLCEVARRFATVTRESETLARIGGDEFVVILENVTEKQTLRHVDRLKAQMAQPVTIDGKSHSLGVSIGIATYPDNAQSPDALLQLADIAMYNAKARGGGYQFYDHDMGQQLARRLQIADRLSEALTSNRLELHYQPIVDLQTGRLKGAEALLRWLEPAWGWVGPAEFIPIAAERRMLTDIGGWVIDRACWQYADWRKQGLALPRRLAVNVAAEQLEGDNLLDSFHSAIDRYGVPASALEAEITESSVMEDPARAAEILSELKALGIRLSIDDFGTGYSSLAYLKQFDTDKLKIDMSFVRDLLDDPNCQAIVSATIGMARGLGLSVLAEGVENTAQADHLRRLHCDEAQGYLFGKPVPPDEFAKTWLRAP